MKSRLFVSLNSTPNSFLSIHSEENVQSITALLGFMDAFRILMMSPRKFDRAYNSVTRIVYKEEEQREGHKKTFMRKESDNLAKKISKESTHIRIPALISTKNTISKVL